MSYCRICGDENGVTWRPTKRNYLCESCNADTPRKVSRERFDAAYWSADDDTPESTRREFYDDYRTSNLTLADYIVRTTSYC